MIDATRSVGVGLRLGEVWRRRAAGGLLVLWLAWAGAAQAVEGRAVLRVGYPEADPPYTQRNAVGQAEGASLALVAAWLQRAGLPQPEWVPLAAGEGPAALQAGGVDLLLGVRGLPPPGLRLVGPYQQSPVVIVSAGRYALTGPGALAGQVVAVSSALQPQLGALATTPLPRWRVTASLPEAMALVAGGEAEAALAGLHAAAERLRTPALADLRITGVVPELNDGRWLALRPDQAALAEPLAAALPTLLTEVLPGLEAEWAGRRTAPGIDWVRVREVVLVATLVALALLASAVWHGRQLRREAAATAAARAQAAQLLGFLAHEVRNVLQSVTGALALWQRSGAGPVRWRPHEVSALVGAVSEASATAVGRLDGLLDQHRLQTGTLGLQRRPEPLGEVVGQAVEAARPAAREAGTLLLLHTPRTPREADAGWWLVDALRLQQVLRNLIDHALAARPPGGVAVELALHPSPMGAGWGLAALAVQARGHELPEAERRRLFAAGGEADGFAPEAETPAGEPGLRLALALTQAMGGTLVAESRPGDGLRFLLHLDLQAATALPPGPPPLRRVLVVDDAVAYGLLLVHALADAGIAAQAVTSLNAAGRVLERARGDDRPDLVLCDSHLGDGGLADWLGWCQGWRRDGRVVAPVIGMSADFDTAEITQLSALGALDLLTKAGDPADLVRRVERIWAAQAG